MTEPIIRRALLSVSDKTGLVLLAEALVARGVVLISTGGTAELLRQSRVAVTDVAEITGAPEIMDGRVKTLHPRVHGGLLAVRDNAAHASAMADHGIPAIDLVVVNLYPFEKTAAAGRSFEDCVERIDIGGPAMIRAAAKNHAWVSVVTDPADYASLIEELAAQNGATRRAFRQRLATKAFQRTAAYDAAIGAWFAAHGEDGFPQHLTISGTLKQVLRYGENPGQRAALYLSGTLGGVAAARQMQGKELSYNNIADTDAALDLVAEFTADETAVAVIKHANPCGVAVGVTLVEAYQKALRCDPVSAFGGIVACSRPLDEAAAREIVKIFTEVIVAPGASEAAQKIVAARANLRLLLVDALPDAGSEALLVKPVSGGFLVQSRDGGVMDGAPMVVTKRAPDAREMADLRFAFTVAKHVKSNAIVYAKDGATVGIGAGQMSRIDATRIAAAKGRDAADAAGSATALTAGSVVASDAFFPFADGLIAAAEAGATAVIQPGGSVKDDEVIAAADARGLAMVLTGRRHFRH